MLVLGIHLELGLGLGSELGPVPNLIHLFFAEQIKVALGLDRCRLQFVGAAPVTMETLKYFQSINIPLYELYGMSESTGAQTVSIQGHIISGSCGVTLDGMETKIVNQDQDGNGEVGIQGSFKKLSHC